MLYEVYAILCVFLPCVIYQVIVLKKRREGTGLLRHMMLVYLFLFYLYLVFSKTGIGTVWDIVNEGIGIRMDEINLIPFQSEGFATYILNIMLFMPLGFLLPLIWKEFRASSRVLMAGLGLSAAIEFGQLFNIRCTDVDDLLMNTLGAVLGYGVWRLFEEECRKTNEKAITIAPGEPVAYLVLAVFGRFLFYNWRWIV